jgi:hypothetical protein
MECLTLEESIHDDSNGGGNAMIVALKWKMEVAQLWMMVRVTHTGDIAAAGGGNDI